MKKIIITLVATLLLPLSSYAQDAFYLSGMLGLTSLDSSADNAPDYDTELSYGLRAGVLFNDNFSAGLYINRYGTSFNNQFLGDVDLTSTNIMAEGTYYFTPADENTFWVSGLLGTTQIKPDCNNCDTDSETSYGVSAGYHFMVAPNFSVSPQFTHIIIDGDDSSSMTSFIANLTFWM